MKGFRRALDFLAAAVLGLDVVATTTDASTTTISTEDHQQLDLVSLVDLWRIGEPTLVSDGLDLVLEYPLSTFVDQNMAYYEVYDANCKDGGTPVSTESVVQPPLRDVAPGSATDVANFSVDGKTATVELGIVTSTIASDSSVYSETTTPGGVHKATIAMCVRFGLRSIEDDEIIEVNFQETILQININLSAGVAVDTFIEQKDRIEITAAKNYTGYAFLCGDGGQPLDDPGPYTQGEMVTVCVAPDVFAASEGVVMLSIESFEWTQGSISQPAIESGIASSNGLTIFDAIDCQGAPYCTFSTLLSAEFYMNLNNNIGLVLGSGVAHLDLSTGVAVDTILVDENGRITLEETRGYTVELYLCGDGGEPLDDAATPNTQNSMVAMCMKPSASAASEGIVMRSIESFVWTEGSMRQPAIESGIASSDGLTIFDAIDCQGAPYCKFSTLLSANFYTNNSDGLVRGSGVARLQFGSAKGRRKQQEILQAGNLGGEEFQHRRDLQQQPENEFSFDVRFSVGRTVYDDRPQLATTSFSQRTVTWRTTAALACILVAIAGILGVIALWWR